MNIKIDNSMESAFQGSTDTHLEDCTEDLKTIADNDVLETIMYVIYYCMYTLTF